jgi:hypothetical protein
MNRLRLHKRDNVAEMILKEVLVDLQKDGKIAGFIQSHKNDRLDKEGIDFLVLLNDDLALPIQVKTYSRNRKRCIDKHFRRHPLVKFVIFVRIGFYNRRPEIASNRLKDEILNYLLSRH